MRTQDEILSRGRIVCLSSLLSHKIVHAYMLTYRRCMHIHRHACRCSIFCTSEHVCRTRALSLSLSLHVCIYAWTHVTTCKHAHTHTHTRHAHAHIHTCTSHVLSHTCTPVRTYACKDVCLTICRCVCLALWAFWLSSCLSVL